MQQLASIKLRILTCNQLHAQAGPFSCCVSRSSCAYYCLLHERIPMTSISTYLSIYGAAWCLAIAQFLLQLSSLPLLCSNQNTEDGALTTRTCWSITSNPGAKHGTLKSRETRVARICLERKKRSGHHTCGQGHGPEPQEGGGRVGK